MKTILLTILCVSIYIFNITESFAQSNEDVVYLKNGSIIRGKIIEQIVGEYVKIESYGKNIWVFKSEDVDKITKEDITQKKEINLETKGYYNITSIGILAGKDTYQAKFSLSITSINGYQHNKIYVGLGLGVEKMDILLFPTFIDIRYNLLKGRFTPFVALQGGYAFPLENNYELLYVPHYLGGYLLTPIVGIRNYFSNNTAIVINAGFRHQRLHSVREDYNWQIENNITTEITTLYNRAYISFAFLFN